MKKFIIPGILLLFLCCSAGSQENTNVEYASTITVQDLKDHLSILASDSLQGRETGTAGQIMAAAYLSSQFEKDGLSPIVETPQGKSFIQTFDLTKNYAANAWIKIGGISYKNTKDFLFVGNKNFKEPIKSTLEFVGEGNPEDYQSLSVKGENVLIYCKSDREERKKKTILAKENGAENVFIINSGTEEQFRYLLNIYNSYAGNDRLVLEEVYDHSEPNYFFLSPSMGEAILNLSQEKIKNKIKKASNGKYKSLTSIRSEEIVFFAEEVKEIVKGENVMGFIEGTDKKNEYIIITAHYDHEGMEDNEIYNGADDDGSGTVAVLELAQAFAAAKKGGHGPRRSILFLAVTGEEKGLLGSAYYVSNPVLPLENTIVDLNIDMVGRVDEKHTETPEYVYLIGSDKLSHELHEISEEVNEKYTQLELDYTYNAVNDPNRFYYRSDHYNFAKNGIPSIFYFNGTHDDYHKPTDTIEKINFKQLRNRTKLIFYTAWELANREDRIKVDTIVEEE